MFLDPLIDQYRQHLEVRNFSVRTIASALCHLRSFKRFLVAKKVQDLNDICPETMSDYQRHLFRQPTSRGKVRSVSYQNHAVTTLRGFFRFLQSEGLVSVNPTQLLQLACEPQRLPRSILTLQEARQIIETPDTGSLLGYRDRTILEVFYATGIRKAELMSLTPEDINLDDGLLRINQGKGGKDRVVPLTQLACSFLKNYSTMVRPELLKGGRCAHLFISQRGGPLSRNALGDLVLRYARQAGVKKHVTCHVWRHSCATHLLKNKANLRHVQELLGHRQLSTTERYLHLTITDLKEDHRRHHPRERGPEKS